MLIKQTWKSSEFWYYAPESLPNKVRAIGSRQKMEAMKETEKEGR